MPKTKASLWVILATAATVLTLFLLPFTPKTAVRTTVAELGDLAQTTLLEGIVCYQGEQPCLSVQAGQVSAVHVRQGQRVAKGDLLFSMDSKAEETALAALSQLRYEREQALSAISAAEPAAALAAQSTWDVRAKESELRASIASKQIRTAVDGVMGGVYVSEGSYVAAFGALGTVRGECKQVTAVAVLSGGAEAASGTLADLRGASGETLGVAELSAMGAPAFDAATAKCTQQLTFVPLDDQSLSGLAIGEHVTVEMLNRTLSGMALVPVSAIGSGDRIWVVENGAATPILVDVSKRNEHFVYVPKELAGKRVVLVPDEAALYAGCPVKEGKAR
ncbi:MAG: biotin/lipoyl-binding protein [Clostridia bacterium]